MIRTDLTTMPSRGQLSYWKRCTNENYHRRVRAAIARFFGDHDRADYFAKRCVVRTGPISFHFVNVQEYLDEMETLLDEIRAAYGDKVYNSINKCL